MSDSFLGSMRNYFRTIIWSVRSVCGSFMTAFPYLFGTGDLRKEVTEQYPDPVSSKTVDDLPPRSRGLLFNDIDRCTGCKECQEVCPTECIHVEVEPSTDLAKAWVSIFDIDFAKCIFCGLCVDVCAPASLTHTRRYENAVYQPSDLVQSFGRGRVTPEQQARWAAMRKREQEDEVSE